MADSKQGSTQSPINLHDLLAASLSGPLAPGDWMARAVCPHASQEDLKAAYGSMFQAHLAGRAWAWDEAQQHLDAAYQALGAVNPGTGADWHAGRHPIQQSRFHPYNDGEAAQGDAGHAIRIDNIQRATVAGRPCTLFSAWERQGGAYVHIGRFEAPANASDAQMRAIAVGGAA